MDPFFIKIDKNIVTDAKINIQRNMFTKDPADGKETALTLEAVCIIVWFVCINIPAMAGPIADPINLNKVLTPKDMPINLIGVDVVLTLIWPTFNNDNPDPITAKFNAICIALVWSSKILRNPIVVIIAPAKITLKDPIFDIIKPEVGPNIRDIIENGNVKYTTSNTFPPIPSGIGVLTRTGMVWKIVNVAIPHIRTRIFASNIGFKDIKLRLISGNDDLFSTIIKIKSEIKLAANKQVGVDMFDNLSLGFSDWINVRANMNDIIIKAKIKVPLMSKFDIIFNRTDILFCIPTFVVGKGVIELFPMFVICNLDSIITKYLIKMVTIITIGSMEKKVICHPKLCVILPPIINPTMPPKENIDAKVPWPIAILFFGNWVWIMAKTIGNIDIPIPWTIRNTIIIKILLDNAPPIMPNMYIVNTIKRIIFLP
jgi:hypothetical protein